jgi:hypothetical protein
MARKEIMKRSFTLIYFVVGLINVSFAQLNSYGISIGAANGMIIKQALEGGPSYDLNTGITLGFQYCREMSEKLHLMTSVNWYKNTVTVTPAFYPNMDMSPENYDVQLIYVPVFIKIDLSRYLFLFGGPIADFDITNERYITSQSGMGAGLGIGTEFPISEKFAVQFNPYLNLHGIVLADQEDYPERVFDTGLKLSLILKK